MDFAACGPLRQAGAFTAWAAEYGSPSELGSAAKYASQLWLTAPTHALRVARW